MKIEQQLPLPDGRGLKSLGIPYHLLEVGDAITLDPSDFKTIGGVRAAANYYMKQNPGIKLSVRQIKDRPGHIGVWRIE
jgi:hypothetical protein